MKQFIILAISIAIISSIISCSTDYTEKANKLIANRKHTDAIKALDNIPPNSPTYNKVYFLYAEAHYGLFEECRKVSDTTCSIKEFNSALENYRKCFESDTSNYICLKKLEDMYVLAGKFTTALPLAEKLLSNDSSLTNIVEVAGILKNLNRKTHARKLFKLAKERVDGKTDTSLITYIDNSLKELKIVKTIQTTSNIRVQTIFCPTCHGTGKSRCGKGHDPSFYYKNYGKYHGLVYCAETGWYGWNYPCSRCQGSGYITTKY